MRVGCVSRVSCVCRCGGMECAVCDAWFVGCVCLQWWGGVESACLDSRHEIIKEKKERGERIEEVVQRCDTNNE